MTRKQSMTLEQCAARMQSFLRQTPRSGKTRAYLAMLKGRKNPPVVTVEEYRPWPENMKTPNGHLMFEPVPERAAKVRGDKVRPKYREGRAVHPSVPQHAGIKLLDYIADLQANA